MNNNPGKKGRPAPWIEREQQDRASAQATAFAALLEAEHPTWYAWRMRRSAAWREICERYKPGFWNDMRKDRLLREWDVANPCPVPPDVRQEVEAHFEEEFKASYVPIDRS